MDDNVEPYPKARTVGNDADFKSGLTDMSQSHAHIDEMKKEELRTTKSFELHHTRSFSEIRHLHPSSTDVTFGIMCPKPKNIKALQNDVKRPESVLEMSDLSVQEREDDMEEDMEEDIALVQEKGDKAMMLFLESNISVPLDGTITSSSCSLESLDSDFASEHELIVGTWKHDARDSLALSGSGLEKRFLTPSGLLLYREQQVDSMLDTKRLHLSPSNSVERPMSPLAVPRTEQGNMKNRNEDGEKNLTDQIFNSKNKQEQSQSNNEEYLNGSDNESQKREKCNCDHYSKLQDLQRVVNEYEGQYRKLVKRREEQFEEIKTLKKRNINMHKEHNRLQLIIKECHKQDEIVKEKITKTVAEKDKIIEELNMNLRHRDDQIRGKNEQITEMRKSLKNQEVEISKYDETFKEIALESKALIQALAQELGEENDEDSKVEENGEDILTVLKKRRNSLQDDFKGFSKHELNRVRTEGKGLQACCQTTDESLNKLQSHMQENLHEITSEYKNTLAHVQQTEKDVENIQQCTAGLETMLLAKQNEGSSEKDLEFQFHELERKYKEAMKENSTMKEDVIQWMNKCDEVTKEHLKLNVQYEDRIKILHEEKEQANLKLQNLKTDIKKRLENSYGEKTASEKQLEYLREKYLNTENSVGNAGFHSQDMIGNGKDEVGFENMSKQKERTKERVTAWEKEKNLIMEKTKALKNQLAEQGKLIECLLEKGQNFQIKENGNTHVNSTENATSWFPEKDLVLSNNTEKDDSKQGEAVSAAKDEQSQLSYFTTRAIKMTEGNQLKLGKKQHSKNSIPMYGGDKVLWEMKKIYQEHFESIQHTTTNQERENQSLKQQLVLKEQDDEINKFYIASLKKENDTGRQDLKTFKTKHEEVKKELRELKDRFLIIDAEQRMSRYFSQTKQGNTVQENKII